MKTPEKDIEDRLKVWDAMQMLYMDTDPDYEINYIAKVCTSSKYTIQDLKSILFQEVLPACRFNLIMQPAPEWAGFEINWLKKRVLSKHRFGKRRPILLRKYTSDLWEKIETNILQQRENSKQGPK
ncbi:hypothetical protein ACCI51_08445 [Microbulbifer echini]|uniref:DUF7079 domain-containing protein n=1 Tax=Microbulbifer echini TaxID=1529067 RepID=A0ABV4NNJ3_9GAMM